MPSCVLTLVVKRNLQSLLQDGRYEELANALCVDKAVNFGVHLLKDLPTLRAHKRDILALVIETILTNEVEASFEQRLAFLRKIKPMDKDVAMVNTY